MEAKLRSALRRRWAPHCWAGHPQAGPAASSPTQRHAAARAARAPSGTQKFLGVTSYLFVCQSAPARFFICLDSTEGARLLPALTANKATTQELKLAGILKQEKIS